MERGREYEVCTLLYTICPCTCTITAPVLKAGQTRSENEPNVSSGWKRKQAPQASNLNSLNLVRFNLTSVRDVPCMYNVQCIY